MSILSINLISGEVNFFLKGIKKYNNKDFEGCISDWNKGCDLGDTKACRELGNLYSNLHANNTFVKSDPLKSEMYFKRACDFGDENGCLQYKSINEYKNTVKKNKEAINDIYAEFKKMGYKYMPRDYSEINPYIKNPTEHEMETAILNCFKFQDNFNYAVKHNNSNVRNNLLMVEKYCDTSVEY